MIWSIVEGIGWSAECGRALRGIRGNEGVFQRHNLETAAAFRQCDMGSGFHNEKGNGRWEMVARER